MNTRSFEVTVPAHTVPASVPAGASWRRFEIEQQTRVVVALDADHARMVAAQEAHIRAGVAAWRPYLRETVALCTVRRFVTTQEREMDRVRRGGRA